MPQIGSSLRRLTIGGPSGPSPRLGGCVGSRLVQPRLPTLRCWLSWVLIAWLTVNGWGQDGASATLQSTLRSLKQRGIPTTNDELLERYQGMTSPADSHAWTEILERVGSQQYQSKLTQDIPLLDDNFEERLDKTYAIGSAWRTGPVCIKFTEQHRPLIEQVRALSASSDHVRLPVEFHGADTLLSVEPVEILARILLVDAMVAIHARQAARVVDDVRALFKVADLWEPIPFLPLKLKSMQLRRKALVAIKRVIETDFLEPADLTALDSLLAERSELGERWKQLFDDDIAWNVPILLDPQMAAAATGLRPQAFDPTHYVELTERIGQLSSADWNGLVKSSSELEASFENAVDKAPSLDEQVAYLLIPSLPAVALQLMDEAQQFRHARLALAIRKYEAEHGVFPESLAALPVVTQNWRPLGATAFGYDVRSDAAQLRGFYLHPESPETASGAAAAAVEAAGSLPAQEIRWLFRK